MTLSTCTKCRRPIETAVVLTNVYCLTCLAERYHADGFEVDQDPTGPIPLAPLRPDRG